MPGRITPLVTGEIYHIFNRGIDRTTTFTSKKEFERAITTIWYYRFYPSPIKLSRYLTLDLTTRENVRLSLEASRKYSVSLLSYCLMPNHFHFLIRQEVDAGISKFLANFQNSYTKYFNTRRNRQGGLFLDAFKAVRVESEEQLLHLGRYIHLNPYTSFLVKSLVELRGYPWSSLPEYLGTTRNHLCKKETLLSLIKGPQKYSEFVGNQANYQRTLGIIRHLTFNV